MSSRNVPLTIPQEEFRSLSQRAASEFIVDKVSAPTSLYIQDDTVLLINATNISIAQQTVIVRATMLRSSDGELTTSETQVVVGGNAQLPAVIAVPLCEGFLLSVAAFGATLNAGRGQLYVEVYLARNPTNDTKFLQMVLTAYLVGNKVISWPGSSNTLSIDGQGAILDSGQGAPGAGAEFSFSINPLTRVRVVSVFSTFTASAAVATRFPSIIFDNGGANIYAQCGDQIGVTAGQVINFSWFGGASELAGSTANNRSIPIPENLIMRVNGRIRSSTLNLQAADTWSTTFIHQEAWVDG